MGQIKKENSIYQTFKDHEKLLKETYLLNYKSIAEAVNKIAVALIDNNKRLLVCGNGGSASDSGHITGELVGRFNRERQALNVIDLTSNNPIITAIGNDYGYEFIFSRQVEAYAKPGDILLGLSTSGNSENVLEAFKLGKKIGTYNIAMTGNDGGKIKMLKLANVLINIPSKETPRIQEMHTLIYHIICNEVEKQIPTKKRRLI